MKNLFGIINNGNVDLENGYTKIVDSNTYILLFDGEIYNKNTLRNMVITKGYVIDNSNIEDIIIYLYAQLGENMLKHLNGVFSIVIYDKTNDKIFAAKDRLGTRPLYYYNDDSKFIVSSRVKNILDTGVQAVMEKEELLELFALGPAHNPSKTYFKGIFNVEAGNYITYSENSLNSYIYWDLKEKEFNDSYDEIQYNVKYLVNDSIQRQMSDDVSSMLSGGLDSSIIVAIARKLNPSLKTYSINYKDNDKDFTPSSYQGTKDSDFVTLMNKALPTNHKVYTIDNTDLFTNLYNCVIAREMPGMADVDSSMYCFLDALGKDGVKNIFSGECSDEIFAGYPWYYNEELQNTAGFPWSRSENLRENLVKPGLLGNLGITNYIIESKRKTLESINHIGDDSFENNFKELNYLTIKYFANALLERGDRMSRMLGVNIRMPFADYRILDYVYNIDIRTKLGLTSSSTPIEKYVLRNTFKDILPKEIVERKKSPFPKTYSKDYLKLLEDKIIQIITNPNSRINEIVNVDYVLNLVKYHGSELKENLFGQLMTYPQTLAYLIQIEYWLNEYNVKICIKK